jgi:hypothetical protein
LLGSSLTTIRKNYIEITTAARDQLRDGNNVYSLFGGLDAPKFRSSIKYFHEVAGKMEDKELEDLCAEVMELLEQKQNQPKPSAWNRRILTSSSSSSSEENGEGQKEGEEQSSGEKVEETGPDRDKKDEVEVTEPETKQVLPQATGQTKDEIVSTELEIKEAIKAETKEARGEEETRMEVEETVVANEETREEPKEGKDTN